MTRTIHVRAEAARVLAIVEETLLGEGFRPATDADAPEARRVVVAEQGGWVTIADDPLTMTDWGAAVSEAIADTPVFTLEGECDHAFYSSITVHEDGEEQHRSTVPDDAVHEDDGRHRIRPMFLAAYFPAAKGALEAGIVVDKLGGAENVEAAAEALGLPNARLTIYDDVPEGAVVRAFEHAGGGVGKDAMQDMLTLLAAGIAKKLGVDFAMPEGMPSFADFVASQAVELKELSSGGYEQHVGSVFPVVTGFGLGGPPGTRARGVTVRLRVPREVEIGEISVARVNVKPEREGDMLVVRCPDLELEVPPLRDDGIPAGEHMRRALRSRSFLEARSSEVRVRFVCRAAREGSTALVVEVETTHTEAGKTLTASSHNPLVVKPSLRRPVMPEWAPPPQEHDLAEYDGREALVGWVAFDRAWPDVRDLVTEMVTTLVEAIAPPGRAGEIEADVLRKGGERLAFLAPIRVGDSTWKRIATELDRGADVTLRDASDDGGEFSISVSHQPEGSNHSPNPERDPRYVPVELTWTAPRPAREDAAIALGRASESVLVGAGETDGNLGGVVLTASSGGLPGGRFESAYETLAGTRMFAWHKEWLRTHVRTPGHRVLVPAGAAPLIGETSNVDARSLAHGVLLSAASADPFTADREPMERAVLSLVGPPLDA